MPSWTGSERLRVTSPVLLCGYYGEHNLGDDALLEALLAQLPPTAVPLVTAFDQEEISRRHREYACGECHMHLPFEAISTLAGAVAQVVQCPSCRRILYLKDEVKGALVK